MVENKLKIFENEEFGKVRTMMIDDEPWFVGKDIAEALGYAKARNAVSYHVDTEDRKDAPIQGSLGGTQNMVVVNESGMYSLILSSKLPTAKKFKHWVTSEVLPTLRKAGAYSMTGELSDIQELSKQVAELRTMVQDIKETQTTTERRQNPVYQSNTQLPMSEAPAGTSWYDRNKNAINKVCAKFGVNHRCIYHKILSLCSEKYNMEKANEIYRREVGHYPMYQMDLVSYFPQLSRIADEYIVTIL